MEILGAKIRNILDLSESDMNSTDTVPLCVNIPCYQRPYRWDEVRIGNLFKDYYENLKIDDNKCDYFVGSVVLVKKKDSERFDIIDGQQRVTTIFLLNYLRFLFLRSFIAELIRTRRRNLDRPLQELVDSYKYLLGCKHLYEINSLKEYILAEMDKITNNDNAEEVYDDILERYMSVLKIPKVDLTDQDKYFLEEKANLKNFLEDDELCFKYSLESFNEYLKDSLSRVCIKVSNDRKPYFHISSDESNDSRLLQYTTALNCIYDCIVNQVDSDKCTDSIDYSKKIIENIEKILIDIKFAVILAGSEQDAYLLFEVLNDRAMEIDDLELIKNLLFKRYFRDSRDSGKDDNEIYNNIVDLDKIWTDEVFNGDIKDFQKRLISYFASAYLTGDDRLKIKEQRYRKSIEDRYLSKVKIYSLGEITVDFRIYQMMRIIIECFEVKYQNKDKACLMAENDYNYSITYRTVQLLNALGYDGVICGLTNVIVALYLKNHDNDININDFRDYIEHVKKKNIDKTSKYSNELNTIHRLSFFLRQMSLLCEDYEIPRKHVKTILKDVNRLNPSFDQIPCHADYRESFLDWINSWHYNRNKNSDLKAKVLFLELFKVKYDKEKDELAFNPVSSGRFENVDSDMIELDHLEPKNFDTICPERYFAVNNEEDRDELIDSIGNMMLLNKTNNINKSNFPLFRALHHYEEMFPEFWLNKLNDSLLHKFNDKVEISGEEQLIPSRDFFIERKEVLYELFYSLINRNYEDKSVKVNIKNLLG